MIDIIIPCYNAHDTLDKTLQSILIQSIKDKVNILIVDDKSDKDYKSVISKYKKLLNIKVTRLRKNMGPGQAREIGISKTSSKYIVFLDSDDIFVASDSLELLYNTIEKGYDYVNSIEYDQKRKHYFILNGNLHGKIYRRDYIINNNIHFNDSRYHEDNFFNNYVILSGAKRYTLSQCTYFYVENTTSLTNSIKNELDTLEIYLENMKELLNITLSNNYPKYNLITFMEEKYGYLRRLYRYTSGKDKETIIKLIKKYDKDLLEYIDLEKKQFKKEIYDYLSNLYLYK